MDMGHLEKVYKVKANICGEKDRCTFPMTRQRMFVQSHPFLVACKVFKENKDW